MKKLLKGDSFTAKKTRSFDNLIKEFMSDNFVLTEENLHKFLNNLHEADYELKFEHLYPIKTVNSILVGGCFSPKKEKLFISVNALLNVSNNAPKEVLDRYKLFVLNSYFHETRHEQQNNEVMSLLNGRTDSAFARVYCAEMMRMEENYDSINSLMEVDARLVSIKRMLELEKKGLYTIKAESSYVLMLSLVQMLDGINLTTDKQPNYPNNPFSCNEILQKISMYKDMIYDDKVINLHTPDFYEKFASEYDAKFKTFFENDYGYLMKKMFLCSKLSNSTKVNMLLNYRIDTNNREEWAKLINLLSLRPTKRLMYELLSDRYNINKDENDITATDRDVQDYFKEKNMEYTEKDAKEFITSIDKHKEFEAWLRNKKTAKKKNKIQHSSQKNELEK